MAKEILKRILAVQAQLVAPKSQYNSFGKYKYRRAEDILEALKPLLKQQELTLLITDEPFFIEGRFYIKATASVYYGDESVSVVAYAREGDTKSGMDPAQITGATSSYARKYALGGLFCIDDNADPDVTNTHGAEEPEKGKKKAVNKPQADTIEPTLQSALAALKSAKNKQDLDTIWDGFPSFQNDPKFLDAINKRFAEIGAK
jgi:hypothetical protein